MKLPKKPVDPRINPGSDDGGQEDPGQYVPSEPEEVTIEIEDPEPPAGPGPDPVPDNARPRPEFWKPRPDDWL